MSSSLRQDITDFAAAWLRGRFFLARAYSQLCTLKLNQLEGKDGWVYQ